MRVVWAMVVDNDCLDKQTPSQQATRRRPSSNRETTRAQEFRLIQRLVQGSYSQDLSLFHRAQASILAVFLVAEATLSAIDNDLVSL